MRRTVLLVPFAAVLAACGGAARPDRGGLPPGGGTNQGAAIAPSLVFPRAVRLDTLDTSEVGRITGVCEVRRLVAGESDEAFGVLVEIYSGLPEDSLDEGFRTVTVMQRTDALASEGSVEVELLADSYRNPEGASCDVTLDWMERRAGLVGLTGSCTTEDSDGDQLQVELELDLRGCDVAR